MAQQRVEKNVPTCQCWSVFLCLGKQIMCHVPIIRTFNKLSYSAGWYNEVNTVILVTIKIERKKGCTLVNYADLVCMLL